MIFYVSFIQGQIIQTLTTIFVPGFKPRLKATCIDEVEFVSRLRGKLQVMYSCCVPKQVSA